MKCPFRKKIQTIISEVVRLSDTYLSTDMGDKILNKEITTTSEFFEECYKNECPYYSCNMIKQESCNRNHV